MTTRDALAWRSNELSLAPGRRFLQLLEARWGKPRGNSCPSKRAALDHGDHKRIYRRTVRRSQYYANSKLSQQQDTSCSSSGMLSIFWNMSLLMADSSAFSRAPMTMDTRAPSAWAMLLSKDIAQTSRQAA